MKEPNDELANGDPHGLPGGVEVFGLKAIRTVRSPWAELTGPPTEGAGRGALRVVYLHPRELCVALPAKPLLVVIDRADGSGRLRKPERQVRVVPGKLVKVLGRETADLVRDQLGAGD
jgi:hypothetical protein